MLIGCPDIVSLCYLKSEYRQKYTNKGGPELTQLYISPLQGRKNCVHRHQDGFKKLNWLINLQNLPTGHSWRNQTCPQLSDRHPLPISNLHNCARFSHCIQLVKWFKNAGNDICHQLQEYSICNISSYIWNKLHSYAQHLCAIPLKGIIINKTTVYQCFYVTCIGITTHASSI